MADPGGRGVNMTQLVQTGLYCCLYIGFSGVLISSNKYLLHEGRFPHPMALSAIHMFANLVLTLLILGLKPSLMPGVAKCKGRLWDLYVYLIPIGCCFAVMLNCANMAYMYCSMAFLQFMKEANVVVVFLLSAMVGLQVVNRQRLFVILWVILGSSMCVNGELNFVLIGFMLQCISQLAECTRAVIAEMVLTKNDFMLDALSYTYFVAPVSLVVLSIGTAITWKPEILSDIAAWWQCLIPSAVIAVCNNVASAQCMKETSAVGFNLVGLVKDIVLVCFSCLVFQETVTGHQWLAFLVTLSGVFFWAYMKVAPDSKTIRTFENLLGVNSKLFPGVLLTPVAPAQPDESTHVAGTRAQRWPGTCCLPPHSPRLLWRVD